ncbi:hypothetical protein N7516_004295 [Penicillium verrucosum]|uniref:uncharacterized protein n=1 Tax=Penicillium verrucosum TaxID=60171 RepID=UPI0025459BC5|nr:uncharacterized protein N7516_004295 [Penicillium verrucosum]KAJ5944127.1 hypothetical protein N7516_004295 [Penicillium verrucosum]
MSDIDESIYLGLDYWNVLIQLKTEAAQIQINSRALRKQLLAKAHQNPRSVTLWSIRSLTGGECGDPSSEGDA